jgi:hypothetical protein
MQKKKRNTELHLEERVEPKKKKHQNFEELTCCTDPLYTKPISCDEKVMKK